jgi:hypothetical protein
MAYEKLKFVVNDPVSPYRYDVADSWFPLRILILGTGEQKVCHGFADIPLRTAIQILGVEPHGGE